MSTPASTSDVEARWRPMTTQETTAAEAFLWDAWALLRTRRPAIEADMAAGTVKTDNIVRVLCAMVLRVLKNPDGYAQESIDDWSGQRADLTAAGVLTVTPEELADVSPGRRSRRTLRLLAYGEST